MGKSFVCMENKQVIGVDIGQRGEGRAGISWYSY